MASHRSLFVILAAGLVVRLALWGWCAALPIRIADEQHYNELAKNLVKYQEFGFAPGEPTSLRPPLYPVLLAGVYWLWGSEAFAAVRLLQLGISLLTVVIVYALGHMAFSPRVGVRAAAFCCFYPSLLGANNLLLTEVVFTFFLSLFCLTVVWAWQSGQARRFAVAGLLLGLGALTRSVLWLFPAVFTILLLAAWPAAWWRRAAAAALLVLAFAVTVAPWTIRNTQLQKTFTTIDVMGGRNFMMGNYEHTPMFRAWDAISMEGEKSWHAVLYRKYPQSQPLTQGQLDKLALRAGLDYVRHNPWLSTKRFVVKFFCFWQLERELVAGAARSYFGPINAATLVLLTVVIFGSYALAMFSGLFGMFLAPPADWRIHAFFVLVMAFICGIHTLVFGHSRYHLPLMPLLLLYSASASLHVQQIWQQARSLRFNLAAGACLIFTATWLYEIAVIDLQRFLDAVGQV